MSRQVLTDALVGLALLVGAVWNAWIAAGPNAGLAALFALLFIGAKIPGGRR